MAKGTNQKLKLLYLAQIFSEETDEDHGLTLAEIAQRLSRLDINAERKTLYQDFEELRRFGMDICTNQEGKSFRYFLGSRTFQLPELKLLVDAVQSSRFITEQKSRELIKKLETLTSRSNANQLQRQVLIAGRIKTMNESIYYNVDGLHTAIAKERQIQFRYFRWGPDKTMILRHNGELYTVSPWHLCWDDENYYLVAYDSASGRIKHYRVDKMKNITITDLPRDGAETMEHLDLTIYTRRLFGMFGGADPGHAGGRRRHDKRPHRPLRRRDPPKPKGRRPGRDPGGRGSQPPILRLGGQLRRKAHRYLSSFRKRADAHPCPEAVGAIRVIRPFYRTGFLLQ